jgi:hypothetical protein
MVKKQPNQTVSLIATNNGAITYLKIGELNELKKQFLNRL